MRFSFFKSFYPTIVWAVIITTLSILPGDGIDELWFEFIIEPDKIAHFGFHFILTFLLLRSYYRYSASRAKLIIVSGSVLGIVLLYGILIELVQMIAVLNRSSDVIDVVFNFAGSVIGLLLYYICRNSKRLKVFV